jgi:hypothetical protein
MSSKTLYRVSGVSAIVGTLLILYANLAGMVGLLEFAPDSSSFDPAEALSAVASSPEAPLIVGWGNIYGTLLLAIAVIGIYSLIRREGGHSLIPLIVFEIGAVILIVSYLIASASVYSLGPLYEQGVREAVFGAEYLRKILFEVMVVFGSWLTLGLAPLLFGLFGLKSSNVPKWLSWMAILGGVIGLEEWLRVYPWQGAERTALVFINIVAFAAWMIGTGVVMLRHRESPQELPGQQELAG